MESYYDTKRLGVKFENLWLKWPTFQQDVLYVARCTTSVGVQGCTTYHRVLAIILWKIVNKSVSRITRNSGHYLFLNCYCIDQKKACFIFIALIVLVCLYSLQFHIHYLLWFKSEFLNRWATAGLNGVKKVFKLAVWGLVFVVKKQFRENWVRNKDEDYIYWAAYFGPRC